MVSFTILYDQVERTYTDRFHREGEKARRREGEKARRREGETTTLRKWVKDREPFPFPICLSNCFVSRHSVVPRASLLSDSPKIDQCNILAYTVHWIHRVHHTIDATNLSRRSRDSLAAVFAIHAAVHVNSYILLMFDISRISSLFRSSK